MPKIQLENFVQYGRLFEVYGALLSADRQQILSQYFDFNMTLAEIAAEKGVSRQAISDALQKSCNKLQKLENQLKIVQKQEVLTEKLHRLQRKNPQIRDEIEKILKEI